MQRHRRQSVYVPTRLAITAGAVAAIVLAASCGDEQLTAPPSVAPVASTTAFVPTSSGCRTFQVTLGAGNTIIVDSVSQYWCGVLIKGTLRPEVSGTPTFDRATGTVRIPIVLRNADTTSVMTSMRTLTLEDSTFIVTPTGIRNWGTGGPYVHFTNWESTTGYTRGGEWQFNPLRPGTIAPQYLPPKSLSTVKWLQMHVLSNVSKYQFMLWSTAPMAPADTVRFRIDEGLSGYPSRDTVVPRGTVIAYAYTVQAAHSTPMLLNNASPVSLTGLVVADSTRILFGWAQRTISVTPEIQPLYNDLRGLLTASDPVSAFQTHLTHLSTLYGQVGSTETIRREGLANTAAMDLIRDSAAMQRVNAALKGHEFVVMPRTDGLGTVSLQRTGGSLVRLPGVRASAVPGVSTDSAEPTTYVYVNGVYTNRDDRFNGNILAELSSVIREIPELVTTREQLTWVYNATSSQVPATTQAEIGARCLFIASTYAQNTPAWNAAWFNCWNQLAHPQDVDWVEAIEQFIAVQVNARAPFADANNLAFKLNAHHQAGEHVILIAHSQGNLMVQQAIQSMLDNRSYKPTTDSACIATLALASPSSDNWPLDAYHLKQVSVQGDQIAALNHWAKTSTPLTSAALRDVTGSLGSPYFLDKWAWWYLTELHSIKDSYLNQTVTRTLVKADLDSLYRECTVGRVVALMPDEANFIPLGGYLPVTTQVKNRNGRPIFGRKIQWWSADSSIAKVDTNGSWVGVYPGTTKIVGRSWQDTAAVNVRASAHETGLGGHWQGSYLRADGVTFAYSYLDLDPGGASGTLRYQWHSALYNSVLVHGTVTGDSLSATAVLKYNATEDSAFVHFPCNNHPCVTTLTVTAGAASQWTGLSGKSQDEADMSITTWSWTRVP